MGRGERVNTEIGGSKPRSEGAANYPSLELVLGELVADAEHLLDLPYLKEWLGPRRRSEGVLEVIEEATAVTVLVQAPGYAQSEITVKMEETEIAISTPDFEASSVLPSPVDAGSLRMTYRNGVLCLVLSKVI